MRIYRERLGVPLRWWLVVTGCVLLFGTTLWAGFSLLVAALIYAGLAAVAVAILAAWGSARIEVTVDALTAGRHALPLRKIAGVSELDREQAAALRGPKADPAAVLMLRPWLPRAVYVEVAGRPAGQPYWLIASRHPAELADAIRQARTEAGHAGNGSLARPAPGSVG